MSELKKNTEQSSELNFLFLNEKKYDFNYEVKDFESKTFYYIDLIEDDLNFNLDIKVHNDCFVKVIICSLNKNKFQKKFNVKIHHLGDRSIGECSLYGLNKNESKTKVDFNFEIIEKSSDNRCYQSIKGILLSNKAEFAGKPDLIINTNNIKAKHSLAIGVLNPNHVNYLLSKGIDSSNAKKLIVMGYFNIVLDSIKDSNPQMHEEIQDKIFKKIGRI